MFLVCAVSWCCIICCHGDLFVAFLFFVSNDVVLLGFLVSLVICLILLCDLGFNLNVTFLVK